MSTRFDAIPGAPAPSASAVPHAPTRAYWWSVRRELWESRSIYLAPLCAAAVVLVGFFISMGYLPLGLRGDASGLAPEFAKRLDVAAVAVILTSVIVGLFYCLDALYGERRDRSILFWKSLPVSDLTSVLAKFSIPMIALPLVAFVVILALQLVMTLVATVALVARGLDASPLWTQMPMLQGTGVLLYGLATLALWHAPIYAWFLAVSAWARRGPLLWAVLAPLALCVIERIGFGTTYLTRLVVYRLTGGFGQAFVAPEKSMHGIPFMPHIDAARFVTSPGVWLGLAAAAALLYAAMRLRRAAEPI